MNGSQIASGSPIGAALARVRERIQTAAERAGRDPREIRLIAVSKMQPAAAIREAYAAGQRRFGESYLQEALAKMAALADLEIEWHFIGRLQSNKTRQIAEHFAWVHSLADPAHGQRLGGQRPQALGPLNVCLQVNLDGEDTKSGVAPEQTAALLAGCQDLPGLNVRGLMSVPAPLADEAAQRAVFGKLRRLRDALATSACPLAELSMGMSDDLDAAVLEGATLVRIGTAIFGPRG